MPCIIGIPPEPVTKRRPGTADPSRVGGSHALHPNAGPIGHPIPVDPIRQQRTREILRNPPDPHLAPPLVRRGRVRSKEERWDLSSRAGRSPA
jgi:hypothetical protein